jgi:hypothetical protein
MTHGRLRLHPLLAAGFAVALLGGCSGAPPAPYARAALPAVTRPARIDGLKSWMAPNANKKDLLYVTITDGSVDVYSYPQGELEGQLSGLSTPYGSCIDKKGDVYITDYTKDSVVKYAHGGSEAIRTLSVPGTGAFACAVDRASGDLAVTTAGNVSGGGANLAIYRKAKGKPKTYTDRAILSYAFCTYDNAGNLFVDGIPANGYGFNFELAELPRRAKSLEAVNLEYGVSWMGGLQWDGKYLAVGQPVVPQIARYTISGANGTYVGSTALYDAYHAIQFILAGNKAIVNNQYYYDRYIVRWDVLVFNYPEGSEKQEMLESDVPVGSVALSRRPRPSYR